METGPVGVRGGGLCCAVVLERLGLEAQALHPRCRQGRGGCRWLQKEFEEIEGVVCSFREAIPYAGRYCPKTRCPNYVNIEAFWDCLTIMDNECESEGPFPMW